jgi:predicted alpha/beta-hydrolase family hydrolase
MGQEPALEIFHDTSYNPPVRGFLHRPAVSNSDGLVLTHGAGSTCNAPLLLSIAETFAADGFTVLRCDLPFRQGRPSGPPRPGDAARDREGLRNALASFRKCIGGGVFLGGHSYGGRQSTMLAASEPNLADGLILLSYPLHPPRKVEQLRTQHFPQMRTPSLFVHGTRDPFGFIEEMNTALELIPARKLLVRVESAGHDLGFKGKTRNKSLLLEILTNSKAFFTEGKVRR